MRKMMLWYFGHLMRRTDSLENTLMLGKIEGRREGNDRGWDGWMASPTWWTWVWAGSGGVGDGQGSLVCCILGVAKSRIRLSNWTELKEAKSRIRLSNWTELKKFDPNFFRFRFLLPNILILAHHPLSLPRHLSSKPYVLSLLHSCILYWVYIFLCDAFRSDQISRSAVSDSLRYFDYSKQASPMLLHFGLALLTEDGGIEIRAMI